MTDHGHNDVTYSLFQMGAVPMSPKWKHVIRRDPCSYCGRVGPDATVDHIHPRALGATRHPGVLNSTCACARCNERKSATPLLQYLMRHPIE